MILYLHGFASSGKNEKSEILKKYFKNHIIISPTLSFDPMKAVDTINNIILSCNETTYLIGTSLGAFYSLYFSHKYNMKSILINPTIDPDIDLMCKVGTNTNYVTGDQFEFTNKHIKYLEVLKNEINKYSIPYELLNFFLSTDDTLIHIDDIENRYKYSLKKYYTNAGHRFSEFENVMPDIKTILNL